MVFSDTKIQKSAYLTTDFEEMHQSSQQKNERRGG